MTEEDFGALDAVRKRPAMYVGSTGFFGVINYLVSAVSLHLLEGASRLHCEVTGGLFRVESDAVLGTSITDEGVVDCFSHSVNRHHGVGFDGLILAALSETLIVHARVEDAVKAWRFTRGQIDLDSEQAPQGYPDHSGSTLVTTFSPDYEVFQNVQVPAFNLRSYFRRLSYLHSGISFTLKLPGSDPEVFHREDGIGEMFEAVTAPLQVMHEPVRLTEDREDLSLCLIFGLHSWKDHRLYTFVNRGRAVEGGTHQEGLEKAIQMILAEVQPEIPGSPRSRNGVVAVMYLESPNLVWEGCIKERIGNPELRDQIPEMVISSWARWTESHPDFLRSVADVGLFHFPDQWRPRA